MWCPPEGFWWCWNSGIAPWGLSVLQNTYRFIQKALDGKIKVWSSVRHEMKLSASLVWITRRSLDAPLMLTVEVEDSATSGYAWCLASLRFNHPTCNCGTRKVEVYSLPEELKKHAANQDLEGFTSSLEDMFERPPGNVDAFVPAALSTECASFVLDAFREKSDLKTSAVTSQARASRADRVDIDVPALIEPLDIVFLRMKITSVCFGPGGGRMFLNTSPSKKPGFCYLHLNVRQGSSRCTGIENLRSVTSLARCVSFQR